MNRHFLILPAAALVLASCGGGGSFNGGGYDPLDAAGGMGTQVGVADTGIRPGAFVKTSMNNAAFFRNKPDGNASADKVLPANTPMKVIAVEGSYVKGELDSGEVGYVLSVQVIDHNGDISGAGSEIIDPNAVQVWPPVGGATIADPTAGAAPIIPTEIDPDAPEPVMPEIPALPDDAPTPGLGAEPPVIPEVPSVDGVKEESVESAEDAVKDAAAE
ncbi:hypothetical protein ACFQY0_10850 [Haloferula chungangensis]|uniref:Uncharacterized protein n=1 Tax=Haloferula chungangensis TaxID=1048331 RepID=A0ABW2L854_9BACT